MVHKELFNCFQGCPIFLSPCDPWRGIHAITPATDKPNAAFSICKPSDVIPVHNHFLFLSS